MITKKALINQLDLLPESFSIDELIDRLILIEKIEIGLNQSETDDVISEEELKAETEKDFEDGNTFTNEELISKYN